MKMICMVKFVTPWSLSFHPYHFLCPRCHREWSWDDHDLIYCDTITQHPYNDFNVIYTCKNCKTPEFDKKEESMTWRERRQQSKWLQQQHLPILMTPE